MPLEESKKVSKLTTLVPADLLLVLGLILRFYSLFLKPLKGQVLDFGALQQMLKVHQVLFQILGGLRLFFILPVCCTHSSVFLCST